MVESNEGDGGSGEQDEVISFDEEFVRRARSREASASERMARLQRIDREHRRLRREREAGQRSALRSGRPLRRWWRTRRRLGMKQSVLVVLLVGCVSWVSLVSWGGPGRNGAALTVGGKSLRFGPVQFEETNRPPPSAEHQDQPLGLPALHPAENNSYEFMAVRDDGKSPVAYDPCRPLHLVVNDRTAPQGSSALLSEALVELRLATGLDLVVDGPSDERPSEERRAYQPERYPQRWAPVLISWSDPEEDPNLAGDVAGTGGSMQLPVPYEDASVYVSGMVTLDGPQMAEILARPDGWLSARLVIQHELGHVVGLDHVDDPAQLMYLQGGPQHTGYGPGDLTGLAHLGRGECFPQL